MKPLTITGCFADARRLIKSKMHTKRPLFAPLVVMTCAISAIPCAGMADVFRVASGDVVGLIDAINAANANGEKDTIRLAPGIYTVPGVDNSTDDGLNGLPSITTSIKIIGRSAIINQDISTADYRIFHVAEGGRLKLNNISFQDVGGAEFGNIVFSRGKVIIENSSMDDNRNPYACLIANYGKFYITRSSVNDNSSNTECVICNYANMDIHKSSINNNYGDRCGAIQTHGAMSIVKSSVSGNDALLAGGVFNRGDLIVKNSTISGNDVLNTASAIENDGGWVKIISSTIADNIFRGDVSSGIVNRGEVVLKNSLLADNTNGTGISVNCSGNPVQSRGHNLDSDATCGLGESGDLSGVDPLLGELAFNGGPTRTHALLPGSPAIDAGSLKGFPRRDQRGVKRPRDGDGDGQARVDIGAFEL